MKPLIVYLAAGLGLAIPTVLAAQAPAAAAVQRIDLAERLAAGGLRTVNRQASRLQADRPGVHVSELPDVGLVWINGTDFAEGTIEIDVRGRNQPQRSFVGIAFHGRDDKSYEGVYLRPFNFRNPDPIGHQHAVQYMAAPDYDWPRLRQEFPEEFENPVDAALDPTAWVPLKIVVRAQRVQIYAGTGTSPALEVRKLGTLSRGMIGLWVGNNSDGDFANLRITPAK
jgi:hypothetical protein